MGQIINYGKLVNPITRNKYDERREIHVLMDKGMHRIKMGIYKIHFDDHFYIGRANNIRTRVKQHMKDMEYMLYYKKEKGNGQKNILKYLIDHPEFTTIRIEILEECLPEQLHEKENYWIGKHVGDPKMFNIRIAATRTTHDNLRSEFKPGIYCVEYKIQTFEEFQVYKATLKRTDVVGSKFLG